MTGSTPYVIGIDIGTTHTKAVAFTTAGKVLASTQRSYPAMTSLPDYHELDPVRLLDAVVRVLQEIFTALSANPALTKNSEEYLAGISFSAAMHSLILVDEEGKPLTNAITWADLRSKEFAKTLKDSEAGKRIYQFTGTPIHPMSPLCKLLWLKSREPDLFSRTAKFVSIKEYIWYRFFGKWQVDYSIASATGLFDIYTLDWYEESLQLAGIHRDLLSMPVPCTHMETELKTAYRELLDGDEGIPFIIGGSDGCLANLGSNAVLPGEAALTIGTSGAIRMISPKPAYDPQERIFNYILTKDLYVSGGAVNSGGAVLQWYVDHFGGAASDRGTERTDSVPGIPASQDPARYIEQAASVKAGSDGLVFLPYLFGERAPIWNADAKGLFFGIHARHTQAHFIRAVLEGISFSLYDVGRSLEETIGPIRLIHASGGFIKSRLWLQIIADLFNKPVCVNNIADASAIGAAMIGFWALKLTNGPEDTKKMIRTLEIFEPDGNRHLIYQENFRIYQELYGRVKDLF